MVPGIETGEERTRSSSSRLGVAGEADGIDWSLPFEELRTFFPSAPSRRLRVVPLHVRICPPSVASPCNVTWIAFRVHPFGTASCKVQE